jgi:hypothetical protein
MGGLHANSAKLLFEPLTRREREVLSLLAVGLISPRRHLKTRPLCWYNLALARRLRRRRLPP